MATDPLHRTAVAELVAEWGAVEASIDIVRAARDGAETVIAVRFDDSAGRARRAMVGLREVDGEWCRTGGFGAPAPEPGDEFSWHTGGWSSHRRAVRGFWVAHPAAVSLRLVDPTDRSHEDRLEHGVGVLTWEGDFNERLARVELLDADGAVVASGPVWPAPALVV